MTYYQNLVLEPVEVIAHFDPPGVIIIRFKWKGKVYKVNDMPNVWKVKNGDDVKTHYTVICRENDMIAELSFSHKDLKWELVQYDSLN